MTEIVYEKKDVTEDRIASLEQSNASLRGEVHATAKEVKLIGEQLTRIESLVQSVTTKPVNVTGWVAVGLTFVGMWGATIAMMFTFNDLAMEPIEAQISNLQAEKVRFNKFQEKTQYELGYIKGRAESAMERIEQIDEYGSRSLIKKQEQ